MQLTFAPGGAPSVGILTTPFFAPAEVPQTIAPIDPIVGTGVNVTFTTNLPGVWTASGGSIVPAADGLSAVWTSPGSPGNYTITVTNEDDPGNVASTVAHVSGSGGGPGKGDIVPPQGVGRSIVGAGARH